MSEYISDVQITNLRHNHIIISTVCFIFPFVFKYLNKNIPGIKMSYSFICKSKRVIIGKEKKHHMNLL